MSGRKTKPKGTKQHGKQKKVTGKAAPAELPGVTGKGVEPLKIPVLDKFIAAYEDAKDKRCKESPKEIAAKGELKMALHQQTNQLPVNKDGFKFYRSAEYGRDYILTETLKAVKFEETMTED